MSIELKYDSVAALVAAAEKAGEPISALVLRQQAAQLEKTEQEIYDQMAETSKVDGPPASSRAAPRTCAAPVA